MVVFRALTIEISFFRAVVGLPPYFPKTMEIIPGYALHEKFTETNRRRSIGQQPGKKSGRLSSRG